MRRFVVVLTGLLSTATLAWAGDWFHRGRVPQRCRLPDYGYQTSRSGNPRRMLTDRLLLASFREKTLDDAQTVQTKTFQLSRSRLTLDHCQLTRVAMTVVDDEHGTWIVHLTARQDPQLLEETRRPAFQRIRRNRFHVTFRGIQSPVEVAVNEDAVLAPPAYFRLDLPPFWVERGQERDLRFEGRDPAIQRFFELVDRAEVSLQYE